jgi:hypothetical protein
MSKPNNKSAFFMLSSLTFLYDLYDVADYRCFLFYRDFVVVEE